MPAKDGVKIFLLVPAEIYTKHHKANGSFVGFWLTKLAILYCKQSYRDVAHKLEKEMLRK